LRALRVRLYRTDLQGEITIVSRGAGYEVRTERAPDGDLWAGRMAAGSEGSAETPRSGRAGGRSSR
jgi:hypothetical protein